MPTKEQLFAKNFAPQDEDLTTFSPDMVVNDSGEEVFTDDPPMQDEEVFTDDTPQEAQPKGVDLSGGYANALVNSFKASTPIVGGMVDANVRGTYQGATGGTGDEIRAAGAGIVGYAADKIMGNDRSFNENYTDALQGIRNRENVAKEQNPVAYGVGEAAGLIGTGVKSAGTKTATAINNSIRSGLLPNAKTIIGKSANLGTKAAQAGAVSAASGAGYGFATGEGGAGERLETAGDTAVSAGSVGFAVPIIGAALAPQVTKLADYVAKNMAIKSGEIVADKLPSDLRKVYNRLRADYPDDAEFKQVLNSYSSTKGKALVEVGGKRVENLAEGSAMYPSGGAKAEEFFDTATGIAPQRLKTTLGKTVSPSVNYTDDVEKMLAAGREEAAPLYKQAYQANQSVSSPLINRMLETPQGKSSLAEAAKDIQNEMGRVAVPDKELTAIADDLGIVSKGGVASGLKLKTLDYVKRGMDKAYQTAVRTDPAEASRILALKKDFVNEVDRLDKTGLYKQARAVSGDYLSNEKAMEAGKKFLSADDEIIAKEFADMGKTEKASYKVGVVRGIRDKINKTNDGNNAARLFKNETTRLKLQSILSPQEYTKLIDEVNAVDNIYKLRNKMVGNSRTAMRQIAAEEFDSEGQQIISNIASGKGLTRTALDAGGRWVAKRFDGLSDTSAKQVAEILYEQDPKKKFQIMKALTQELESTGSNIRKTDAAKKLEVIYGLTDAANKKTNLKTLMVKPASAETKSAAKKLPNRLTDIITKKD
jgi:hypothetical protein